MTLAWWVLLSGCIYVCCHFAAYLAILRHVPAFRREHGIFLYHLASFALLVIGTSMVYLATPSTEVPKASIGALSVHAIYSMSFLEAWSLSQISYSIAILDAIETKPGLDLEAATRGFADTGQAKKASRLSSLQRLGVIVMRNEQIVLAPRGRAVAVALSVLRWVANLRDTG